MSDLVPWMAPWSGRLLVLAVAAVGLWIIWRGLFHDQTKEHPRCPKCWYDVRMLPSSTCPECGHMTNSEVERYRTRRHWRVVVIGLMVMMALPVFVVQRRVRVHGWEYYTRVGPVYWLSPMHTTWSTEINGYQIEIRRDRRANYTGARTWERFLRVRQGRIVFVELQGWWWEVGGGGVVPGTDLTGNGKPNLVVSGSSGGTSGETTYLLEIGDAGARVLAELRDDRSKSHVRFEDLDHDGCFEAILHDWTFAYWNTSGASSPAPRVILSWTGDRYLPNPALMREHVPSPMELHEHAAAIHIRLTAPDRYMSALWHNSELWGTMLDLIYSGHADVAYEFFDVAWPAEREGKLKFLEDFQRELATSPHRDTIEALGHPALPAFSAR